MVSYGVCRIRYTELYPLDPNHSLSRDSRCIVIRRYVDRVIKLMIATTLGFQENASTYAKRRSSIKFEGIITLKIEARISSVCTNFIYTLLMIN